MQFTDLAVTTMFLIDIFKTIMRIRQQNRLTTMRDQGKELMGATRSVGRSGIGTLGVIASNADWEELLGVEDGWQLIDGGLAVHVADSDEGDEFTEATITHAGKAFSLAELDARAEGQDEGRQSQGHFPAQARAERLVDGQILNVTTDIGNVFRRQQETFLLGFLQTISGSFTTIAKEGVFARCGNPNGEDGGDVVAVEGISGVGEDDFAFHGRCVEMMKCE